MIISAYLHPDSRIPGKRFQEMVLFYEKNKSQYNKKTLLTCNRVKRAAPSFLNPEI